MSYDALLLFNKLVAKKVIGVQNLLAVRLRRAVRGRSKNMKANSQEFNYNLTNPDMPILKVFVDKMMRVSL
jgi:hypothetical protein